MNQPAPAADAQGTDHQDVAETIYRLLVTLFRGLPRDLSLTAMATLSTLERTGPRRITDLAAIQGVAQPSMTALITNLERSGYVERRSDPDDRRVALVSVTQSGATYIHGRRRAGAEAIAELVNHLPDDELAALTAAVPALHHLRELHNQQRDPGPPVKQSENSR
ncbi:MarR family winged helix-turn-helix transcriptional regulator [Amycolatopsis taiwanensis]|uniref:MarR family transcriptional regulator n=1 Tax=Amycolatopsis taiwanensis TaxID=342230 RepID=A0A9W6R6Z9_9PSEU|nr:MarR family transcriptional regulator [Amycolatopsis taiwanensis]GLY69913.1 MarR family transcriptional regulator [Amycolatopsis taiwanensis]